MAKRLHKVPNERWDDFQGEAFGLVSRFTRERPPASSSTAASTSHSRSPSATASTSTSTSAAASLPPRQQWPQQQPSQQQWTQQHPPQHLRIPQPPQQQQQWSQAQPQWTQIQPTQWSQQHVRPQQQQWPQQQSAFQYPPQQSSQQSLSSQSSQPQPLQQRSRSSCGSQVVTLTQPIQQPAVEGEPPRPHSTPVLSASDLLDHGTLEPISYGSDLSLSPVLSGSFMGMLHGRTSQEEPQPASAGALTTPRPKHRGSSDPDKD